MQSEQKQFFFFAMAGSTNNIGKVRITICQFCDMVVFTHAAE